jgi:Tol biopolymer transport system component
LIVYEKIPNGSSLSELWISNADGSNPRQLTSTGTINTEPAFAPGGRKIAWESYLPDLSGTVLMTMRIDGSAVQPVIGGFTGSPYWSPDGRRIAYADFNGDGGAAIDTIGRRGRGRRVVVDAPSGFESRPVWSPDGTQIAYAFDPSDSGSPQTYIVPATGGSPDQLTASDTTSFLPLDWLPAAPG